MEPINVSSTDALLEKLYGPLLEQHIQTYKQSIYLGLREVNESEEDFWARLKIEAEKHKVERSLERKEATWKELTLNNLLERMGMKKEFAEHYIQPYCYCNPFPAGEHDDDNKCAHAEDLELKSGLESH